MLGVCATLYWLTLGDRRSCPGCCVGSDGDCLGSPSLPLPATPFADGNNGDSASLLKGSQCGSDREGRGNRERRAWQSAGTEVNE